jgi:hypothetical protein
MKNYVDFNEVSNLNPDKSFAAIGRAFTQKVYNKFQQLKDIFSITVIHSHHLGYSVDAV